MTFVVMAVFCFFLVVYGLCPLCVASILLISKETTGCFTLMCFSMCGY